MASVNVADLLQSLADAIEVAKAKGTSAEEAGAFLTATKADAQQTFDAVVGAASADFDAAKQAYLDAQTAVERLRQQVNEKIGVLLPASRARVR